MEGDLQRRLANIVRRGVIHSTQHGKIPKCRVSIGELITDWLPLCQGFSGGFRSDVNPCTVGDAVTVLSEGGDLNNGRVFPGWATGGAPVPEGSESEHITVYGDGTEVRYDREAHALTITIAAGGTYIDILSTPKNSRVLVRDYGSDLPDLIDNPQDESTRVRIVGATASALARWEPRLTVKRVQVVRDGDGVFDLTIEGINKETGQPVTFEGITIYGNKS
ncbi:phage baseplate assembly protein V [Hafnia alvei]